MNPCYLFSLRTAAWMSRHGTYTSDVSQARVVDLVEAIIICAKHKDGNGIVLIPVRVEDVEALV